MQESNSSTDFLDLLISYFTLTSNQLNYYNMNVNQIRTPPIEGPFSFTYKIEEISNRKKRAIIVFSSSVVLVKGGDFITFISLTVSNLYISKLKVKYLFLYT